MIFNIKKKRNDRIKELRKRLWVDFIRKNLNEGEDFYPTYEKEITPTMIKYLMDKKNIRAVKDNVNGFEVFFFKYEPKKTK